MKKLTIIFFAFLFISACKSDETKISPELFAYNKAEHNLNNATDSLLLISTHLIENYGDGVFSSRSNMEINKVDGSYLFTRFEKLKKKIEILVNKKNDAFIKLDEKEQNKLLLKETNCKLYNLRKEYFDALEKSNDLKYYKIELISLKNRQKNLLKNCKK